MNSSFNLNLFLYAFAITLFIYVITFILSIALMKKISKDKVNLVFILALILSGFPLIEIDVPNLDYVSGNLGVIAAILTMMLTTQLFFIIYKKRSPFRYKRKFIN